MRNGKRYARMQVVVILEVADIERNSSTVALFIGAIKLRESGHLNWPKVHKHVKNPRFSGANILLG